MNKYHAKTAAGRKEPSRGERETQHRQQAYKAGGREVYNRSKTTDHRSRGLNEDPGNVYGQNGYNKETRQAVSKENKAHRARYK